MVIPQNSAAAPKTYPENLYYAVFGDTEQPLPENPEAVMHWALDRLDDREAGILRMRYQEGGKRAKIAAAYGLTVEVARSIELRALRKLRHPSRSKVLRYGLDENGAR